MGVVQLQDMSARMTQLQGSGHIGLRDLVDVKLQFAMLHKGMDAGMEAPRFEPLAMGEALTWKYRGQVKPHNKVITTVLDIVDEGRDGRVRRRV